MDGKEEKFDYSHGYEYIFQEGTYHDMLNWVRENDCSEACVRGEGYGRATAENTGNIILRRTGIQTFDKDKVTT